MRATLTLPEVILVETLGATQFARVMHLLLLLIFGLEQLIVI